MIEHNIFYETHHLSLADKVMLLNDAFAINERWWVDILDCNISFARQKIELSFDDIMLKFHKKAHFVVIHRKGYEICGEIGFCTLKSPEYFLWIHLSIENLNCIIIKYNLKPMI